MSANTWCAGRKPPSQTWHTFLENHAKQLVSVDFVTVPTIRFQVLYVFLILAHDRRRILHFNVTAHPTCASSPLKTHCGRCTFKEHCYCSDGRLSGYRPRIPMYFVARALWGALLPHYTFNEASLSTPQSQAARS